MGAAKWLRPDFLFDGELLPIPKNSREKPTGSPLVARLR